MSLPINPFSAVSVNVPQGDNQVQKYLQRCKEFLQLSDTETELTPEDIKESLSKKVLLREEDIPPTYWDLQVRIAREEGHGQISVTDEIKSQMAELLITDQRVSLDAWIDYFTSLDAPYSDEWMFWVTKSIISLAEYDKVKKQFPKRSKGTVRPFPELNREALAHVWDVMQKQDSEASFARLYAAAVGELTPSNADRLQVTKGEWIKYERGSDHMPLVRSLAGHGTGWCTAGIWTAKTQLGAGDFYIYYSENTQGKAVHPRVAIRMEANKIAEVRGIAERQNLDPFIGDIVKEKLKEFPDAEAYQKKATDMQRLTTLERKMVANEGLTPADLRFLYEIDDPIQGFGYKKDPRIEELKRRRSVREDLLLALGVQDADIVDSQDEMISHTAALMGNLYIDSEVQIPEGLRFVQGEVVFKGSGMYGEELASRLIQLRKTAFLAKNLDQFSALSSQTADLLMDSGHAHEVAKHMAKFSHLDEKRLLELLIAVGMTGAIKIYAKNFRKISFQQIADILIGLGDMRFLATGLRHFKNLSRATAVQIIEGGKSVHVAADIQAFAGSNHQFIADLLIERGESNDLLTYISNFTGIDEQKTAEAILQKNPELINRVLRRFPHVQHNKIALLMLEAGYAAQVSKGLLFFHDLNAEVRAQLIENGFADEVEAYASSFT